MIRSLVMLRLEALSKFLGNAAHGGRYPLLTVPFAGRIGPFGELKGLMSDNYTVCVVVRVSLRDSLVVEVGQKKW